MKSFFRSLMVILGTLLAAALVALGEPGAAEVRMAAQSAPAGQVLAALLGVEI